MAILLASFIGLLAFLADLEVHGVIFNWLLSISALSTLFTWSSICLCHIRFRKAWAYNSHPLEQLPFRSTVGVFGSWFGLIGYTLVLVSQFWIAVSPISTSSEPSTSEKVQTFFLRIMAVPIILVFYTIHKIWFRTRGIKVSEMDIKTGRRYFRIHIASEQEQEERMRWPIWKKAFRFMC